MIADYNTIRVKPLGGALGAEISGIDLNEAIPDEQLTEVRQSIWAIRSNFLSQSKLTLKMKLGSLNVGVKLILIAFFPRLRAIHKLR